MSNSVSIHFICLQQQTTCKRLDYRLTFVLLFQQNLLLEDSNITVTTCEIIDLTYSDIQYLVL